MTDGPTRSLPPSGDSLAQRLEALWARGQAPDPHDLLAKAGVTAPADVATVLAVDQWHRWHAGERVSAESYLARQPAVAADPAAALTVIYGEFLVREELGEAPSPDELLARFPARADALRLQLGFHRALDAPPTVPLPAQRTLAAGPGRARPLPLVPGYEILGELGRGGMGVVYKARQTSLNRLVALKMILAGVHVDEAGRSRFRAEAETIARLQHPNIVQIHEVGEHQGHPFLTLELLDGGSLDQHLAGTPLPPHPAAALVETLARAVQHAHEHGVVHRDLKPGNVLLAPHPQAGDGPTAAFDPERWTLKVTDFGLAKRIDGGPPQTRSGAVVGTPSYMAPEQAGGKSGQVGPRADVYALGAILYELLSGRPPFLATTALDTLLQVLAEEPVPLRRLQPQVPRDLETICHRCLEKDAGRRYPTAGALAEDLRRFQAGEPVAARPVGVLGRTAKWARRRPTVAALLALVVLSLLGGTTLASYFAWIASTREGEARAEAGRANESALQADASARRATEFGERMHREKENAERRRYLADMRAVQAAYQQGHGLLVRDLLAAQKPDQRDGEDWRGWEWHYWDAVAQFPRTVAEHAGTASLVAFRPDVRRLATAGSDGRVRLWDFDRGRELWTASQGVSVGAVAFSSDGRRLALGLADWTARVLDAESGAELLRLAGHGGRVEDVAFSPDDRRLATGSDDATARLWDLETGQSLATLTGHTVRVTSVSFSPDGARLATGGSDAMIRVWNTTTGRAELTFRGASYFVHKVVWCPDGRRLASTSWEKEVRTWDARTGIPLAILPVPPGGVADLGWSPDGTRLAAGLKDQTARVWDSTSGEVLLNLRGHEAGLLAVRFAPDGRHLATTAHDHTVRLWDTSADPESVFQYSPRGASLGGVCFSPEGRRLAWAGFGGLVLLDVASGAELTTLGPPASGSRQVAWSGDGRLLACPVGRDGTVRLWDAATGHEVQVLKGESNWAPQTVAFSPDGRRLAGAAGLYAARVWDLESGRELWTSAPQKGILYQVCFSPDGTLVAGAGSNVSFPGEVKVWDAATGQERLTLPRTSGGFDSVCIGGPDGKSLAAGTTDGEVHLWDGATGRALLTLRGHTRRVRAVRFHPSEPRLATASEDGTARLWDLTTGREVLTLRGRYYSCDDVQFSPDGRQLAGVFSEANPVRSEVRVWSTAPARAGLSEAEARAADHRRIVIWHAEQAEKAALARQFTAAAFHYGLLSEREPDRARWHHGLAEARLALGERSAGAAAIARALARDPGHFEALADRALLALAARDLPGYRRACATLVAVHGRSSSGRNGLTIAWCCALAAGATTDLTPVLRLAEQSTAVVPGDTRGKVVRGAVLLRLGRHAEAVPQLEESLRTRPAGSAFVAEELLLALANHGLGRAPEAHRWLERARASMDRGRWPVRVAALAGAGSAGLFGLLPSQFTDEGDALGWRLAWDDRISVDVLRREAEAALAGDRR